jgi:hypothetical protein
MLPRQKNILTGGPIVETFTPDCGKTNLVGFAHSLMVQDSYQYTLTPEHTFTRADGSIFKLEYINPNFEFLAD